MGHLAKILLIIAACAGLSACDEFGWNPLDPDSTDSFSANHPPPEAPVLLMELDLPTLTDSASFYDQRVDIDRGLLIRRRTWRGPPGNDVAASMMEIRGSEENPLGEPPHPSAAARVWEVLSHRQLDFQILFSSRNAVGPVLWRRFVMGPQVCVLFSQGITPNGTVTTRHLLGYYCSPSGVGLTDGRAETVIRSVKLQEGDPSLTPDG